MSARPGSSLEAVRKNPLPGFFRLSAGGCGIGVLVSSPVVSQGLLSSPRGHPHVVPQASKPVMPPSYSSQSLNPCDLLYCQMGETLCFIV